MKKWHKVNWDKFNELASANLSTFIPENRNLSDKEIDNLIKSLTRDIFETIEIAVPKGRVSRGSLYQYDEILDHWFKERRRLKRVLKRASKAFRPDADRIEHIRRSIAAASKSIEDCIRSTKNEVISRRISNINNN